MLAEAAESDSEQVSLRLNGAVSAYPSFEQWQCVP